MEMSLTIGINLNNLTISQYQLIMNGLDKLLEVKGYSNEEERKEIQQFFEKLTDIEKSLIALGEM